MRKVISISETLEIPNRGERARASADAVYDEAKSEMEITLRIVPLGKESLESFRPETIKTIIPFEEALPAAKDIFHGWLKKFLKSGLVAVAK